MKTDDIKVLLDKFYRGETSLAEESLLVDFFGQEAVPEEFLPDKKLFSAFALSDGIMEKPEESSKKIESLIDSFTDEARLKKNTKRLRIVSFVAAVAASLTLLFGIRLFHKHQQADRSYIVDTYKNPDEAYLAAMNALQLFSENFAKGTESIEKANVHLEKTQEIINHSIK